MIIVGIQSHFTLEFLFCSYKIQLINFIISGNLRDILLLTFQQRQNETGSFALFPKSTTLDQESLYLIYHSIFKVYKPSYNSPLYIQVNIHLHFLLWDKLHLFYFMLYKQPTWNSISDSN